jgi:hypothetical protein
MAGSIIVVFSVSSEDVTRDWVARFCFDGPLIEPNRELTIGNWQQPHHVSKGFHLLLPDPRWGIRHINGIQS